MSKGSCSTEIVNKLRPRLHWNGSKRFRTSMGTDRPSVYTGPVGSVPVRIHYPYQFGIALQSVPVWIRSS